MTETLFYHLERRSLEDVLPGMVETRLAGGDQD
jgi:DNA polymerase IIIc chi subunit